MTADQMRAAMADARNFIAQSGVYQECLINEVEAAKTQAAAAGQPFDPAIETGARAKVEASQKAQEKAGAAPMVRWRPSRTPIPRTRASDFFWG